MGRTVFLPHKLIRVTCAAGGLRASARMQMLVKEVDEWMPRSKKGRVDILRIKRRVDEDVLAREQELERAGRQRDSTALWKNNSQQPREKTRCWT